MGKFLPAILLFSFILGLKAETEFRSDDNSVLILSKADFKKAVDSVQHLLVEFCKYSTPS